MSPSMNPQAEIVRRFVDAFRLGDEDHMRDELAPDVTWTVPGATPVSGTFRGPDEVVSHLRDVRERTRGTFGPFDEHSGDVAVGEVHVVVLDRYVANRDGRELDSRQAWAIEVRGGRIAKCVVYLDDEQHFEDFWAY